jgi:hypothetical protein
MKKIKEKPIPFISFIHEQGFVINNKAIKFLS